MIRNIKIVSYTDRILLQTGKTPRLIIAGCGAADILANADNIMQLYSNYSLGLIRLLQPANILYKRDSQIVWMIQDPVEKERLPTRLSRIENSHINLCNKAAEEVKKWKLEI